MFYFPRDSAVTSAYNPQCLKLDTLIDGVDRTFARMKDFSADFVQIEENPLNRKPQASGHLYVMAPRMMRMEYRVPDEQYYVSDGKTVYLYVPRRIPSGEEGQMMSWTRKASTTSIPLALVVGRADLRGEFTPV